MPLTISGIASNKKRNNAQIISQRPTRKTIPPNKATIAVISTGMFSKALTEKASIKTPAKAYITPFTNCSSIGLSKKLLFIILNTLTSNWSFYGYVPKCPRLVTYLADNLLSPKGHWASPFCGAPLFLVGISCLLNQWWIVIALVSHSLAISDILLPSSRYSV